MATLVLGAVGTALGGPVGGALGALAGRQIDGAIIGTPAREGPRLTELAVTTSSYGQPIPRHFGAVRAPGVVVWATDLVEDKETSGGGKGKPKTTSYSYSVSFAVALSSTPIENIGRIWADGNLLRGASGDLKVAGTMRVYDGSGNQPADPLISALEAESVPGLRGTAYVVFEDLALGDFGNRIPALSFEIFQALDGKVALTELSNTPSQPTIHSELEHVSGFSDNGGPLAGTLSVIDKVSPIACTMAADQLRLVLRDSLSPAPKPLPTPLATIDQNTGHWTNGASIRRGVTTALDAMGLRYYDQDRDYQIGVQRATGPGRQPSERILEFPATTSANSARSLSSKMTKRLRWQKERISLTIIQLDPELTAGSYVSIPQHPGIWRIVSWEWMDRGIELELERAAPNSSSVTLSDPGHFPAPTDLLAQQSQLWAFELPPVDVADAQSASYFVAIAGDAGWSGATLYADTNSELTPLDLSTRRSSTVGHLASSLPPSQCTHLERGAYLELDLIGESAELQSCSIEAVAMGRNRLFLDGEVLQFCSAEQIASHRWRLSGLLRGRAGTEHLANELHPAGAAAILLNSEVLSLASGSEETTFNRVAAIGLGDSDPVYADIQVTGSSTAPLSPVHTELMVLPNGDHRACWTRRARGAWLWLDSVGVPLVEESVRYLVGVGEITSPNAIWETTSHEITLSSAEVAALVAQFGPAPVWVKQIGTYGQSPATLIAQIG